MTIKKFFKFTALMLFTAFTFSMQSNAAVRVTTPTDNVADARTLSEIVSRVTEIQNMDKTNLSAGEKKELRKELKEMKRKADGLDKRVYLSVGAIIVIVLLLILILK